LNAPLTGPVIHIFDFHRKQEIVVKWQSVEAFYMYVLEAFLDGEEFN
jgi:hypothetical protein